MIKNTALDGVSIPIRYDNLYIMFGKAEMITMLIPQRIQIIAYLILILFFNTFLITKIKTKIDPNNKLNCKILFILPRKKDRYNYTYHKFNSLKWINKIRIALLSIQHLNLYFFYFKAFSY